MMGFCCLQLIIYIMLNNKMQITLAFLSQFEVIIED